MVIAFKTYETYQIGKVLTGYKNIAVVISNNLYGGRNLVTVRMSKRKNWGAVSHGNDLGGCDPKGNPLLPQKQMRKIRTWRYERRLGIREPIIKNLVRVVGDHSITVAV